MSLAVFENFLRFAERSLAEKANLPAGIDAAEFENALVNYGVVLLHSHMEQCIKSAVEARCRRCTDPEILTLALGVKEKETGRIGIEALLKTLGRFSKAYKKKFGDRLRQGGQGPWKDGAWESVKTHRDTVAHYGRPAQCSLADLRLFYEDIRKVLGFFCDALSLSAAEIASISALIVMVSPTALAATPSTPPPPPP
jgi:hypothetical protein